MSDNRIIDGVGRKIVDALKHQSELEIQNVVETSNIKPEEERIDGVEYTTQSDDFSIQEDELSDINSSNIVNNYSSPITFNPQPSFKETETFASDLDELDMPTNVAVLKQLISQLPAGVSKQTGAQIIKQTMEALGISMKSVLQEAQQLQENLNNKSRECQASVVEYKKQITVLERQSQKLQRQSSSLNDIISLFVQTSI
jgi:hypothetical protein